MFGRKKMTASVRATEFLNHHLYWHFLCSRQDMEVIYETVYRVRHELMGHYAAESAAPRADRKLPPFPSPYQAIPIRLNWISYLWNLG